MLTTTFQFHKGTIKAEGGDVASTSVRYFNSIKVQLKPERKYKQDYTAFDFNSIKVQLKLLRFIMLTAAS
mgnify:CR=1 FL=1